MSPSFSLFSIYKLHFQVKLTENVKLIWEFLFDGVTLCQSWCFSYFQEIRCHLTKIISSKVRNLCCVILSHSVKWKLYSILPTRMLHSLTTLKSNYLFLKNIFFQDCETGHCRGHVEKRKQHPEHSEHKHDEAHQSWIWIEVISANELWVSFLFFLLLFIKYFIGARIG